MTFITVKSDVNGFSFTLALYLFGNLLLGPRVTFRRLPGSTFTHDITSHRCTGKLSDSTASNLKSAFVLVCLNRFQQIITCHTFQAPNDAVKVSCLTDLYFSLIFSTPSVKFRCSPREQCSSLLFSFYYCSVNRMRRCFLINLGTLELSHSTKGC